MCAVLVLGRVVNQLREFVESHALCTLTEDKEQALDQVGLSGTVRTDHSSEALVQWSYLFPTVVRLEILEAHTLYHQATVDLPAWYGHLALSDVHRDILRPLRLLHRIPLRHHAGATPTTTSD